MSEFRDKWPEMRMKHLELMQNAIIRMGANSAALKGYCMGIVAALIALSGAIEKPRVLLLSLPIIVIFAVLDAAYLALERGFRNSYDELRIREIDHQPDFFIAPSGQAVAIGSFFSWSVAGFYGSAILIMLSIWWVI